MVILGGCSKNRFRPQQSADRDDGIGAVLVAIGYDPAVAPGRTRVTAGSGVEFVANVPVEKIEALGHPRTAFPFLCHTLPPSAGVDGLLGLDSLRGHRVEINLRAGCLTPYVRVTCPGASRKCEQSRADEYRRSCSGSRGLASPDPAANRR